MENTYTIFKKNHLEIELCNEEISIPIPENFYSPIPDTESYRMFKEELIITRIKEFIKRQKGNLTFIERIKHRLLLNDVILLIGKDIENTVSLRQLYDFTVLFFNCLNVSILKYPKQLKLMELKELENIKHYSINNGKFPDNIPVSKIRMPAANKCKRCASK